MSKHPARSAKPTFKIKRSSIIKTERGILKGGEDVEARENAARCFFSCETLSPLSGVSFVTFLVADDKKS